MKKQFWDLTNPQKSIWLTEEYYKGSSINNIAGTLLIKENVNFVILAKAINLFIEKNDSLRMQLTKKGQDVKQFVVPYSWQELIVQNINNFSELNDLESSFISEPFNCFNEFLYEFIILRFPDGTGGFMAKLHHVISDAWTMSLLINQIMDNYSCLLNNQEIEVNHDYPSYLNFISSEENYLSSPKFLKSKDFWNREFSEDLSLTYLNDNFSNSCKANRLSFSLEESKEIFSFCKKLNISPYSLFIATLGIYLAKINNSNHFILGSPVLNRSNFMEKNTTGMFISTVPFKSDFNNDLTCLTFIKEIVKKEFNILRNQKYPYNILLDDIRKQYGTTKNLFDIALSYQNARDNKNSNDISYSSHWLFNGCVSNNIDIHVYDMDNTGVFHLFYDYKTDLFSEEEITSLHQRLLFILKQILKDESTLLQNIEIITPEEKTFLLDTYNSTDVEYPCSTPVYQLFEKQVAITPEHLAISDSVHQFTYQEFNTAVNHLTETCNHLGLQKSDKVCLFFNNSIELVASILACLKCGITYIPIDTSYPTERIQYIFENSSSKKILSNYSNIGKLESAFPSDLLYQIDFNDLDIKTPCANPNKAISSQELAYIIYTSGSTGNPKGVQIPNKSLTNYIYWGAKQYVNGKETNFPLYSSIAFDLTVTSIYTPLITGNTIYIYENSNPELLLKNIIQDNKVQIIKLTPAHLILLLDCITLPTKVCKLIVGGDLLTTDVCKKIEKAFAGNISIYNEYGPTEATVGCMIYQYCNTDTYTSVPIGTPIDNVKLYILNDTLQPMPFEQNGELYIGGDCLAKGYLNLPEKTDKSFIPNPFHPKEKLYKTGDIVRMHSNGIMEYIGRSDFQVKINGYRIEIGEIQARLFNYPHIKDCYISILDTNESKAICAYYVAEQEIEKESLRAYLSNFLPHYMLPKYFIKLDTIPLTSNGKINKSLLPIPSFQQEHKEYVAPETPLQETLHSVFCKLLNLPKVSISSNLFDYYIDSLLLIKAQTLLLEKGITINTQTFYEYPTIKELSDYLTHYHSTNIQEDLSRFPQVTSFQQKINPLGISNNILLIGATGFLGIHILYELLTHTNSQIYCLIRNKNHKNSEERFYEKFVYYFSETILNKYKNRISVIPGNILEEHLGIEAFEYESLGKKVNMVIDTAALVKHYGNYRLFKETNVDGTQKVIDFCEKYHLPLHYVSTMSVSGYGLVKTPNNVLFTEEDFYIGQNYKDNVYVRSKFEAENLIFQECKKNNLIASVYRIGNIANRFSDGQFQENNTENAFINRIIAFLNLGCIPQECLSTSIEFTPVDICANFIVQLLQKQDHNLKIYHLYNNHTINLSDFSTIANKLSFPLHTVSLSDFKEKILSSSHNYFGITGYLGNLDSSFGKVIISNEETNLTLNTLGLSWPYIDTNYIEKVINYLQKNSLIDGGTYEKN